MKSNKDTGRKGKRPQHHTTASSQHHSTNHFDLKLKINAQGQPRRRAVGGLQSRSLLLHTVQCGGACAGVCERSRTRSESMKRLGRLRDDRVGKDNSILYKQHQLYCAALCWRAMPQRTSRQRARHSSPSLPRSSLDVRRARSLRLARESEFERTFATGWLKPAEAEDKKMDRNEQPKACRTALVHGPSSGWESLRELRRQHARCTGTRADAATKPCEATQQADVQLLLLSQSKHITHRRAPLPNSFAGGSRAAAVCWRNCRADFAALPPTRV